MFFISWKNRQILEKKDLIQERFKDKIYKNLLKFLNTVIIFVDFY